MKIGIKETSELLRFGLNLANGCAKSMADGKITLLDSIYFKDAVIHAPEAFSNVVDVPLELADLDNSEAEELKRIAVEEFCVDDEKVDSAVKAGIGIAVDLVKLVNDLRA